jgi:hypothetical protein
LLDSGFLSFSMACSTEKLPGFCAIRLTEAARAEWPFVGVHDAT